MTGSDRIHFLQIILSNNIVQLYNYNSPNGFLEKKKTIEKIVGKLKELKSSLKITHLGESKKKNQRK